MAPLDPLDDVAFLARSPRRVHVLETLEDGPRARPTLHEETEIPQPTLGRVLGDFEDRDWVERRDGEYALTPPGELVVEAFGNLLETVDTVQRLDDVARMLPTEEFDFSVDRLGSATITTPTAGDVFRHVRRAEEFVAEVDHLRIVTGTMMPGSLADLRDRVVFADEGDLLVESVVTGDALEQALATPEIVDLIRDLLESGRTPIYRYDGTVPMTIAVGDGTALLAPEDKNGIPGALVETDDETVRAWVTDRIDEYRDESTALTVADLPG